MKQTVDAKAMIQYLQEMMDAYKEEEQAFKEWADEKDWYKFNTTEYAKRQMRNMVACKEMVETLIEEPVNLRKDGKVTVGF